MESGLKALSIADLIRFREIVTEIERLGNPAQTMQEVASRVSLANVSHFLQRLRQKLGSPALIESTPGVGHIRVTDAGKKLDEFARQVEAAVRFNDEPASKEKVTLYCGALFAARILPQLLRKY